MDYKLKRRKKSIKSWKIIVLLIVVLISISSSYALYTTQLTINGSATGIQNQLTVTYLFISNSISFPSSVMYMDTFTYTFLNPPDIDSIRMGARELINGTDFTYISGTLTIPNVTENLVIEGTRDMATVTFNVDGNTNSVEVPIGENVSKPSPGPVKNGYGFLGWADENDIYFDFTTPITTDITLYAKWIQNRVAEIDGVYYTTLKAAVNAVPTTNTEKTIKLLTNINENSIIIAQNKVINFDFQDYTISINDKFIFENSGTITISNGTLTSSSTSDGAINNKSTGNITISGGHISLTASGGKQAIYNNGGTVLITGTAYISSASSANTTNARAAVHNLAGGTLTITGGTIESTGYLGVKNEATMTIGTEDGNPDRTTPVIIGTTEGVESDTNYSFYNGIIKGKDEAVNNLSKISNVESGYDKTYTYETISGEQYEVLYLDTNTCQVTFNVNGGALSNNVRYYPQGESIGRFPVPSKTGSIFDGWFTKKQGGEQITTSTIINTNETFYAHWTEILVAEVNGNQYSTITAAIEAAPNNTQTTVTLLKNTSEAVTVKATKNIILNLQNYTLSNKGNSVVIDNKGTLTISNGNLSSNNATIIDNESGATLIVNGGRLTATGKKQAIYNYSGGIVEISGDAYLSSSATEKYAQDSLERATVQNLAGGTISITGGTIIGTKQQAISNSGTLTLGTKNGNINTTSPEIRGNTVGLKSNGTVNFYDGILKGITGGHSGNIDDQETNSQIITGSETISGKTYITEHLEENE